MKSLNTYIPIDRRQAIINKDPLPTRASGSVLFADISGFTPLTTILTEELGFRGGAEAIIEQLNQVYTALIAEVHSYKGSIIGFMGDAIMCWFNEDKGLNATTCAIAMQNTMQSFKSIKTPAGSIICLNLKIIIANGPVRRFVVGHPDFGLIDTLAGYTLERIVKGEKHVKPNEVMVDVEIANHLKKDLTIAEWREDEVLKQQFGVVQTLTNSATPTTWIGNKDLADKDCEVWIWPSVYEHFHTHQEHFLTEFKLATSLFLKFSGLDYDDDEEAGTKLDGYIRWVQKVLDKHNGTLIQLTIGDKGSFLYAAFGAPLTRDNDTVQAVIAALALQDTPADFAYINQIQIGLTQGQMRCGAYGSPTRRTYGVFGDKTNLAARLMGIAKAGQILCDFDVYQQTRQVITYMALSSIKIKGKSRLIRIYQPLKRKTKSKQINNLLNPQSPIIGRKQEINRLASALDALKDEQSQILIIKGEAGIGKSRLIAELGHLSWKRDINCLLGAGQSIEQQTPYRAWRDIFNGYFDLSIMTDLEKRQEQVEKLVQSLAPKQIDKLPLLNDVLNLNFPDNDFYTSLNPLLRQQNLTLFLIKLLQIWASINPLVIILEDAHWLDSLSWQITRQVALMLLMWRTPFLLIIVTRPMDKNSNGAQYMAPLQTMEITETLSLNTLSPTETVELVTTHLNLAPNGLPQPIIDLVYKRAGGNPFFAEELIFSLRDQGIIKINPVSNTSASSTTKTTTKTKMKCELIGDLDKIELALAKTLQGIILARLDRLPPERRLILKVASVIGRSFAYKPLYYILNQYTSVNEATLKKELQALLDRDFTRMEDSENDATYIFKHIITQEVTYGTLLFSQRRTLHHIVAEWYKLQFKAGSTTPSAYYDQGILALLVHHYHHATDYTQERIYAKLAAEQATAQFATIEAIRYFCRALELTPEDDLIARYNLLLAREKVYDLQSNHKAQYKDLTTLSALAEALDDDHRRLEVLILQAQYADRNSNYATVITMAQEIIDFAQQINDLAGEAAGYLRWGVALWRQQYHYETARLKLEYALQCYRQLGDLYGESEALNNLGVIFINLSNYDLAINHLNKALAITRTIGNRQNEGVILLRLGIVYDQQGEFLTAKSYFQQSLDIYQSIGDQRGESKALNNLGSISQLLGDYEQAKQCYEQALKISQEVNNQRNRSFVLMNLGHLYYDLAQYELSKTYAYWAANLSKEIGSLGNQITSLTLLGHALVKQGHLNKALNNYETALEIGQKIGTIDEDMEALAGLANIALLKNNYQQAQLYINKILPHCQTNSTLENIGDRPLFILLICYKVLKANKDTQAKTLIKEAYQLLQKKANRITDEKHRQNFLQTLETHQEIITAWTATNK